MSETKVKSTPNVANASRFTSLPEVCNKILELTSSRTQQIVRRVSPAWQLSVKRYYATRLVTLDFSTDKWDSCDNSLIIPDVAKARLLGECARLDAIKFSRPQFNFSNERTMAQPTDDDYDRMDHFYQLLVNESKEQKFEHVKDLNLELNGARNLSIVANLFENLSSLNLDIFEAKYLCNQVRSTKLDRRVWTKFTMLKQLTLRTCLNNHLLEEMLECIGQLKMPLILQSFTLASKVCHQPPMDALLLFLAACPLLQEFKMVPIFINARWDWLYHLVSTLQKLPHFRTLSFFLTDSFPLIRLMNLILTELSQLETLEISSSITRQEKIGRNTHGDDAMCVTNEGLPNMRKLTFGNNFPISASFLTNLVARCRGLVELRCSLQLPEIITDDYFKSVFFALAMPVLRILDIQLSYSYSVSQKVSELVLAKIKRLFAKTSPKLQLTISSICQG